MSNAILDNDFNLTENSHLGVYVSLRTNEIVMKLYTETDKPIQPVHTMKLSKRDSRQLRCVLKELEAVL